LYNLATDLGEEADVAADNPTVVGELSELMQRCIDRGRSNPGPAQKNEAVIQLRTSMLENN
jgi:hypothetical protein